MSNNCVFRYILTSTGTLKIVRSKSPVHGHDPKFLFPHRYKQSLQYTIKTRVSGLPMPKFEANINYIYPSPSSSMKQCYKSATVKFHMEILLIRPRSNLAVVRHHTSIPAMFVLTLESS